MKTSLRKNTVHYVGIFTIFDVMSALALKWHPEFFIGSFQYILIEDFENASYLCTLLAYGVCDLNVARKFYVELQNWYESVVIFTAS